MHPLPAGAPFPDRTLPRPQGGELLLSPAWTGRGGLVVLGHADCATTRLALPFVDRMHRSGARVVLVLQDTPEAARALIDQLSLAAPTALDPDPYRFSGEVGIGIVPTLFLVGGDGRVARVVEGFQRSEIETLASELGLAGPIVRAGDEVPDFRPG